jgi:crossover junction endodeoxyribonuclease RuvC
MGSQKFLGLDISLTGTGACIVSSDYSIIKTALIAVKPSETGLRLFLIRNEIQEFLKEHQGEITLCCIEGPSFGSKDGGRLFQIGECTGVIKLMLFELGIPLALAVPSQLKKYISGTGKDVKKEHIMLDIYKRYGVELRDNNVADAYVLSRICRDYSSLVTHSKIPEGVLKFQEEVLKAMYKTHKVESDNPLL